MNTQRIAPVSAKLKRGSEHYLNGNPVYIERDRGDGTLLISDSKQLRLEDNFWTVNKSDLKIAIKYNTTLKVVKLTPAKQKEKDKYSDFYKSIAHKVTTKCQNCRIELFAFTNKQCLFVSAHIFPKNIFKSIATDPNNILFMGVQGNGMQCRCRCHTEWDATVENRISPRFIHARNLALRAYNNHLKKKMTAKEVIMAEEYLGITTKSNNLLKDLQGGVKP
ncbi:hypothetical protein [Mucilaginibacter sp. 10I4]|uniref:hypothetical protein n=1 Tax=Mucilaginibacter sp. 10I4 TaxID=3048580 RepID=UPI002B22D326|nr:hypothetical protein [Mucilaginibacter sp. 10I4]MEB0262884.1 hypothetical protein [Mucilaginibacter sp. 10I4]